MTIDLVGTIRSAGFSHGGFYNHFQSKGALVAEAFEPAAEALGRVGQSPETFARAMEAYLSVAHRDDPASGCPTAALAADAARQDVAARRAYAEGIGTFLRAFEAQLPGGGQPRQDAMVTLAGMIGAMVLARGIGDADDGLSREVLEAVRQATLARLKGR